MAASVISRQISASLFYRQVDFQFCLRIIHREQVEFRVHNFDFSRALDISSSDFTVTGYFKLHVRNCHIMQYQADLFDLKHNLQHIFPHTGNRTEFVAHILNVNRGNCCTVQGRKQNSAKSITKCYAIPAFQRGNYELCIIFRIAFKLDSRCYHIH